MSKDVRSTVPIQVKPAEVVQRKLLIGPSQLILLKGQTRIQRHIHAVVHWGFRRPIQSGHHQVLSGISIDVDDTSSPTKILNTTHS